MAEIISLDKWKDAKEKKKTKQQDRKGITGFLVWLHCPNCEIYEYTELRMPSGRIHKCGVVIEEVEVTIDIRTEWTVSLRNLKTLEQLVERKNIHKQLLDHLDHLIAVEKEYQSRLKLIAKREIKAYPDDWEFHDSDAHTEFLQDDLLFIVTPARQVQLWFPHKKSLQQKDIP